MIPITLLGRITRDVTAETVKVEGEETTVVNNALAIHGNKNITAFIDFTAWGRVADGIARYYQNGSEIIITGELRNGEREISGKKITTVYFLVKNYEFTYGNKRKE